METVSVPTDAELFAGNCPTREVLANIADKWTTLVITLLAAEEPRRFNELRRAIGGISQKMLTETLRSLERDGLVQRTLYPQIPPRVEYALTPLGRTLIEPLNALAMWAQNHMQQVHDARERFDTAATVGK